MKKIYAIFVVQLVLTCVCTYLAIPQHTASPSLMIEDIKKFQIDSFVQLNKHLMRQDEKLDEIADLIRSESSKLDDHVLAYLVEVEKNLSIITKNQSIQEDQSNRNLVFIRDWFTTIQNNLITLQTNILLKR